MNVLLTHLHLDYLAGSETYTYTLVRELVLQGHEVQVVTPIKGLMAEHVHGLGADVHDSFPAVRRDPDILHCQHNVMAMAARARFPSLPLVYHCHSTEVPAEQPPSTDLNIQRFIAVSPMVKGHLANLGVSTEAIRVLENPVDTGRFAPRRPIAARPERALALSSKIDDGTRRVIDEACGRLGIEVRFLGRGGLVWDVEDHLDRVDVVFSLGRGAIEAMACGRAVFVYDHSGADGWVTPESVDEIASCTFSGKRYRRRLTADDLVAELRRYDPLMGAENRRLAEQRYDVARYVPRLLAVYDEARLEFERRSLALPDQEIEVALTALAARIAEKQQELQRVRAPGGSDEDA